MTWRLTKTVSSVDMFHITQFTQLRLAANISRDKYMKW